MRSVHITPYLRLYHLVPFYGLLPNGLQPFPEAFFLKNFCILPSFPQCEHLTTISLLSLPRNFYLGPLLLRLLYFLYCFICLPLSLFGFNSTHSSKVCGSPSITIKGITNRIKNELGSKCNEGMSHILKSFRTGASRSGCLMSHLRHALEKCYPSG